MTGVAPGVAGVVQGVGVLGDALRVEGLLEYVDVVRAGGGLVVRVVLVVVVKALRDTRVRILHRPIPAEF